MNRCSRDLGRMCWNNWPRCRTALLLKMPALTGDSILSRQPWWDTPLLWLLIPGLLVVEWSLRRMTEYG